VTRATIALEAGPMGTAGLDLDGIDSDGTAPADGSGCAHTDVVGTMGETGVDAQLVVLGGVIQLFGFGDINATLQQTINDGGLSVLVELDDLHSLDDDPRVTVRAFRGDGPVAIGTDGFAEPGQSFDVRSDTDVSVGSGAIERGVLRFGPLPSLTLPLRFAMTRGDVRLTEVQGRFTLREDGSATGMLGGVVPVEDIQALVVQAIADGGGTGDASLLPILERALRGVADTHLDAETMRCTGITAGIEVDAVEAFVLR
ncbi:MAG: hypothetical protein KC668_07820, partial [Myxococcales bacterium]|nr:hypothetical protein [Myxococcales bacterium]